MNAKEVKALVEALEKSWNVLGSLKGADQSTEDIYLECEVALSQFREAVKP